MRKKKKEREKRSPKELAQMKRNLAAASAIDHAANMMRLTGSRTRLKVLYLLDTVGELCVADLGQILRVSESGISQHLALLRMNGLVASRRRAPTVDYRLTDHPFIATLRDLFLRQLRGAGG